MPAARPSAPQIPRATVDRLCEQFPLLLRGWTLLDTSVAPLEPAMRCGRGWTTVLQITFEALEADIEDRLLAGERLRDMPAPWRVRERFGELRIDLLNGTAHSDRLLEVAADLSRRLCPRCGRMGLAALAAARRAREAPCCSPQASTPATR